jgi:hypothetical protein
MSSSIRHWLRLPSRIALLLGLGALSVGAVKADTGAEGGVRVPQQSAKSFGDMSIWSEEGRIFVAEIGTAPEELRLGDTPEAALLRQMLAREGATAANPRVLRDKVILVGGGGDGFHWGNPQKSTGEPDKTNTSAKTPPKQ